MTISKAKAKKMAYENEKTTYGDLLDMLDSADMTKPSRVNKSLPKEMVIKIMRDAIINKKRDQIVVTTTINIRDKAILTGDGINMQNILHECG